ncbi:MAG: hypothetical protein LH605_10515 [Microbacteriaceae bacterium]|nr:hypothetical protein [Microbacteriaceae bacterium]
MTRLQLLLDAVHVVIEDLGEEEEQQEEDEQEEGAEAEALGTPAPPPRACVDPSAVLAFLHVLREQL